MKRRNSSQRALVAYLCHFRPEPEGGFTVTCPKLPPVVTYGETLEEAQANAREAIELCLEVMWEDGRPIPPPTGISPRRSISSCRLPRGRMRALPALILLSNVRLAMARACSEHLIRHPREGGGPEPAPGTPALTGGLRGLPLKPGSLDSRLRGNDH
jgi:antitoxin HicB